MPISSYLYNTILKEDINAKTLNNDLIKVLKEILNHDIIINYNNNKHTIHPYWIELYYYIDGNINLQDPFCDIDIIKKTNNKLYFKSLKSIKWNRNRMDICLGNDNAYISILIKRAAMDNEPSILTDSLVANFILNFCNKDVNNLTYSLCRNNDPKDSKNILFTRRVNIYSDINDMNEKERRFANKLYAAYDSNKIECTTKIIDN